MKLFLLYLLAAGIALGQNPNCPGATGTTPHCVVLSWLAPTSGDTPASYNVYRSTTTGICTWTGSTTGPIVAPAGCIKVGSVIAPALTFTDLSSVTNALTEGATYFYVVSSANATGESGQSTEASAKIPVTVLSPPATPSAVPH